MQGLVSFDNLTVRPDKKGEVLDEMQLEDVVQGHMSPLSLSSFLSLSLSLLSSLSLSLSTIVVNIVHNIFSYFFQKECVLCFIHAAVVVGVEDEEEETLSLSLRGDHLPIPMLDMCLVRSHKCQLVLLKPAKLALVPGSLLRRSQIKAIVNLTTCSIITLQ